MTRFALPVLFTLGCPGTVTHATYNGEAGIRLSPVAGAGLVVATEFDEVWVGDQYDPVDEVWLDRTFWLRTVAPLEPCVELAEIEFTRNDYDAQLYMQDVETTPFGILWYSTDDQPDTDLDATSGSFELEVGLEDDCLGEGEQMHTLVIDWEIDPDSREEHKNQIGQIWPDFGGY